MRWLAAVLLLVGCSEHGENVVSWSESSAPAATWDERIAKGEEHPNNPTQKITDIVSDPTQSIVSTESIGTSCYGGFGTPSDLWSDLTKLRLRFDGYAQVFTITVFGSPESIVIQPNASNVLGVAQTWAAPGGSAEAKCSNGFAFKIWKVTEWVAPGAPATSWNEPSAPATSHTELSKASDSWTEEAAP